MSTGSIHSVDSQCPERVHLSSAEVEGVLAQRFSSWAAEVSPGRISDESLAAARRVLLDDLAAVMAGHGNGEVKSLVSGWHLSGGHSTVLSGPIAKTDSWTAAELNALAGCWLELDGGFRIATAHAGLYVVPTALAVGEETQASVGELLAAIVVGYEAVARVATAWDIAGAGSHAHGAVSAIGSAVAASRLRSRSAGQVFAAITTAATLSQAAPFNHALSGALARNLWAAVGARSGQVAAHAAYHGIAGQESTLEDTFGTVFGAGRWRGDRLPDGYGAAIQFAYHKPYSCCQFLHSAVEGAMAVRTRLGLDADSGATVERITARLHSRAVPLSEPDPATTLGARFSAPHAIAASVVYGTAGPGSFSLDALRDSRVQALRKKVDIEPISGYRASDQDVRDAEIKLRLKDGTEATEYVAIPLGDPERPMAIDSIIEKAGTITGGDVATLADLILTADLDTPLVAIVNELEAVANQ